MLIHVNLNFDSVFQQSPYYQIIWEIKTLAVHNSHPPQTLFLHLQVPFLSRSLYLSQSTSKPFSIRKVSFANSDLFPK